MTKRQSLKKKRQKTLLIIDMIKDFVDPEGVLYCGSGARKIIPFIKKKAASFRKRGEGVIYLCDAHSKQDRELNLFKKHALSGSKGSRITAQLAPAKKDLVLKKHFYDAALNTGLIPFLKKHKIKDVYLTGVCTAICILETVGTLYYLGYNTYVYKAGVADFDKSAHHMALERMKTLFGSKIL